jgi:hypothetical protein
LTYVKLKLILTGLIKKHNIFLMKKITSIILVLLLSLTVSAQTIVQNSGWLTFVNNTKLKDKLGFSLDVQIRSADNWEYVRNVLIRPGLTYNLNSTNMISAGYLWASTETKGSIATPALHEQRVWEQYLLSHRLKGSFVSHRFRLEQRFIEQFAGGNMFAQRFRYFVRLVQPLQGNVEAFKKGAFIALQDELFLNIQNKELLNNNLFDQNRFYFAVGYRSSKKLDVEAGYLNQYLKGVTRNTSNGVVQLAIYTRF